ncbi:MAG: T9SS type A sorting domain-containing protein [Candidatus Kapaibacterium sp.]
MRRYYIIIFLMLVASTAWAQDSTQTWSDLDTQMDTLYMDLDTTYLSTGLLINKGLPFMNLPGYEGQSGCDTLNSYLRWEGFYLSLYHAAVSTPTIIRLDTVEKWTADLRDQSLIPIGVLNFNYDQISATAVDDSLISISGNQLHDVPGRPSSPYEVHRAFVASTLIDDLDQNDSARFIIDSRMMFSNRNDTISQMELDAGNGSGFVQVTVGAAVSVAYNSVGAKTLTLRMITTDGDTLSASFALLVKRVTSSESISVLGHTTGWPGLTAARAYNGEHATGDALILYSDCGNTAMRKPVILVEGFDPANEKSTLNIWTDYSGFISDLRAAGYDVLILNFSNGGDYIVRNAYLLETVIDQVNAEKELNGSHHELVVIGASMGGVIARYALADMESRAEEHHARLYVSFDAPHRGANVPLGVQSMFAALQQHVPPRYQNVLSCPAAKELLMYHISDITYGGYCHISLSYTQNALRTGLINALNSIGYPSRTRNIALINGTVDMSGQGFNPGTKLLDGHLELNYLPDPHIEIWSVPAPNDGCKEIFEFNVFLTHYSRSISGTPPLDNAPGSWWDYHKQIAQSLYSVSLDAGDHHCFIPSVSSLDIAPPYSNDLFYDIGGNNVVSTGKTPFDTYYAPSTAERHVTLNNEMRSLILAREIFTDHVYVQNRSLSGVIDFEADVELDAGNNVIPSGWGYATGPVTVQSGADVEFVAGSKIILKPGMGAVLGSNFWAHIDANVPCHTFPPPPRRAPESIGEGNAVAGAGNALAQNFPNPASTSTVIRYTVGTRGPVQLTVSDLLGRTVAVLVDEPLHNAGSFSVKYDVSTLRPGVYYYSLRYGTSGQSREMMVVR